MKIKEAETYS